MFILVHLVAYNHQLQASTCIKWTTPSHKGYKKNVAKVVHNMHLTKTIAQIVANKARSYIFTLLHTFFEVQL
jgi:hypothetical protein